MEKTATLNLRVNPDVKDRAEAVLSKLGIPMSTAITIYLNQISLTGGIPFAITLPKVPDTINADQMTTEEFHAKLEKGYEERVADLEQRLSGIFCRKSNAESVPDQYPAGIWLRMRLFFHDRTDAF